MTDILIILLLILLNGVFAMSELALVSARHVRLEKRAEEGSHGARLALQLAGQPSMFLSTVQVGITLITIFMGAFGEASLAADMVPYLSTLPLVGPYAPALALAIVVISITFVSIILGELVPKRIAMQYPEAMSIFVAPPLRTLSIILSPFVKILSITTDAIVHLLGIRKTSDEAPTEEDIAGMMRESTNAGVFEKTEYDIASRAMRLDDRHLKALMTPRVDLEIVDLENPTAFSLEQIANSQYSRFPVCRGDRSHMVGFVKARDLFEQAVRRGSVEAIDISAAVRELLYVPETVSAMDLLELFKKNSIELALIVDEYGDIQGLVTMTDVMSALVGDVTVIGEAHDPDAVQRPDGSWLIDGGMPMDRFRDLTQTEVVFPEEENDAYHTLAGFVLLQLGVIPRPSDHFDWEGFRFEVVDMDGNRIDRLLVTRLPRDAQSQAQVQ